MNIPILEIPQNIQELCQNYKYNFNISQFKNFENFITGIIINDHADIDNLSKGFELGKHYDSLHHFVSESHWDIDEVMNTSVSVIKHLPDKNKCFNKKGWLIIDDSLIEKFGKFMEAISKQYDYSEQRYLKYSHCLVALTYIDKNNNRYPLKFDLYLPERYCAVHGEKFRTKIQIAQTLIQSAINQGIPFQGVIFDSWYFCKELVDFLEENNKDWVTQAKTNRNIVHQGKTISLKDYTKTITTQEKRNLPKLILNQSADNEKSYRYQTLKKSFPSHVSVGELCQRAFNQALKQIITWVIQQVKNFTPDHQILSFLGAD